MLDINVRDGLSCDEALGKMRALAEAYRSGGYTSPAFDHEEADAILCAVLCRLGYDALIDEYDSIIRWFD